MPQVKCKQCGDEFYAKPAEIKKGKKYCSRKCFSDARISTRKIKTCLKCGKEITVTKSIIKQGGGKYCSYKCSDSAKRTLVKRKCKTCTKPFDVKPSQIDRSKNSGIYCSKECAAKGRTKHKPIVRCKNCQKEFKTQCSRPNRKYCSTGCYNAFHKGRNHVQWKEKLSQQCEQCGNLFSVEPYRGDAKYCSRECKDNAAFTRIEKSCEWCSEMYSILPSRDLPSRKYCSIQCRSAAQSETRSGENNPNYVGGPFPHYGPDWTVQKRKARKRDNYTCQRCGKNQKQLNRSLDVHHLIPRREFGDDYASGNALSNLVSVCKRCHKKVETYGVDFELPDGCVHPDDHPLNC